MKNVIAIVLAGGAGKRLRVLTIKEAKPADFLWKMVLQL
ncbi:MAG: sugar phosphate nucleotidyltransferase [Patescibacteria group bacterium]|nr:sugar phosphate nucleotidyltransferase [Patescibacteria group bacterium]